MEKHITERLLIITKTYPSPSNKYRETSCVAAINSEGQIRRLFPVPFRLMEGDQQFKKWEWIEARIIKANGDQRPESYNIDIDSLKRLESIGTRNGWAERLEWIEPHIIENVETLENRRQNTGETLGFIKPTAFELEIKPADSNEWTGDEKNKLIREGLFDTQGTKQRIPLRKLPYDFYYRYKCSSPVAEKIYRHKITDWEIGALFWNCHRNHGPNWEKSFTELLQTEFSQKKDIHFLMGTIHRFPDIWLIVGLVYPPKVHARQQAFLLPPSE